MPNTHMNVHNYEHTYVHTLTYHVCIIDDQAVAPVTQIAAPLPGTHGSMAPSTSQQLLPIPLTLASPPVLSALGSSSGPAASASSPSDQPAPMSPMTQSPAPSMSSSPVVPPQATTVTMNTSTPGTRAHKIW